MGIGLGFKGISSDASSGGGGGGGGGPDIESALINNTRSEIGNSWVERGTLSITTSGIYEIAITGVVASDSAAATAAVQLRALRDGVPLAGYALNADANGVFFERSSRNAWAPESFSARLLVYSDGTDTFTFDSRNSNASNYHAVGLSKIRAWRVGDLSDVDLISTRASRWHAELANYAYDNAAGPVDWWSDAFTGYRMLDGIHGGGTYGPDGWAAGVDTVDCSTSGGWTGNVPGYSSTDHTFIWVATGMSVSGDFRNLGRFTPAGSEIGCIQCHTTGSGSPEVSYIYGHGGTVQQLGVTPTAGDQALAFVFDKTGDDEIRLYRATGAGFVELASDSLTGQTGQTFSATNQGWQCFPTSAGFGCPGSFREVLHFSNALDGVSADWATLEAYVASAYSL